MTKHDWQLVGVITLLFLYGYFANGAPWYYCVIGYPLGRLTANVTGISHAASTETEEGE